MIARLLDALELTITINVFLEDVVSHPVGAVPKAILEHLLAPVNHSLYAQGHARKVIVLARALAQIQLNGSEEVHAIRAAEVAGVLRLVHHGIVA